MIDFNGNDLHWNVSLYIFVVITYIKATYYLDKNIRTQYNIYTYGQEKEIYTLYDKIIEH